MSRIRFANKNGLSVERAGDRTEDMVISDMNSFFNGTIISVLVRDCDLCNAILRYLPTKRSKYHSEIHGSKDRVILSQSQCKCLARNARICI